MKRVGAIALTAILLFHRMPTAYAVGTSASSAILMEAESGRVLYEHNSHEPRLIASTTKLMTALVAVESGVDPEQEAPVPDQAIGVEGSSIYLQKGEVFTLKELLYGMLLQSGNDAATAVALLCADTQERFVGWMNQKARQLGMTNTHFDNPSGLDGEDHHSSAYDMALLARACLEHELLAEIVSAKTVAVGGRSFKNHNKLLWSYEGCVGMKTGYTRNAGRTLVSAARRGGMTLIAVTLNDPQDWVDHAALLDWGFSRYTRVCLVQGRSVQGRVPVKGSLSLFADGVVQEDFCYPVSKEDKIGMHLCWNTDCLQAPLRKGEGLGTLHLTCNDELIAQLPVCSAEEIKSDAPERRSLIGRLLERILECSEE